MQGAQLEPFFDPATPLPPGLRRRILAMYRLNAAAGDERLGELLRALRASGQWDRTLIVVTSIHGEEIGEHGQVLHGGNLGRAGLEVPLVIKLPQGSPLWPRRRLHFTSGWRFCRMCFSFMSQGSHSTSIGDSLRRRSGLTLSSSVPRD
jgi:hypothetical protein